MALQKCFCIFLLQILFSINKNSYGFYMRIQEFNQVPQFNEAIDLEGVMEKSMTDLIELVEFETSNEHATESMITTINVVESSNDESSLDSGHGFPPAVSQGDDSKICKVCKDSVALVEHAIKYDNATLEMAKEALEGICDLFPKEVQCKVMVERVEDIINWVENGMNPNTICTMLTLCHATSDFTRKALKMLSSLLENRIQENDDKPCIFCVHFAAILELVIEHDDSALPIIKAALQVTCPFCPFPEKCSKVSSNFDLIVDELKKGVRPTEICKSLKTISNVERNYDETVLIAFREVDEESKPPCIYCVHFTAILELVMEHDNASIPVIKQAMEIACPFCPHPRVCNKILSNFDTIVADLNKGMKPNEICKSLELLLPATVEIQERSALQHIDFANGLEGSKPPCVYCVHFSAMLELILEHDSSSIPTIRKAMEIMCPYCPHPHVCKKMLSNFDTIVADLNKGMKPTEICKSLEPSTPNTRNQIKTTKKNSCFYCIHITGGLELVLEHNRSVLPELKIGLELGCAFAPKESKCKEYINKFDEIVSRLDKGDRPKSICEDFKLCDSSIFNDDETNTSTESHFEFDKPLLSEEEEHKTDGCFYCEHITAGIELAIEHDLPLQSLRQGLELACTIAPPESKCGIMLSKFDTIVADLKKGMSPKDICSSLKLCISADSKDNSTYQISRFEKTAVM